MFERFAQGEFGLVRCDGFPKRAPYPQNADTAGQDVRDQPAAEDADDVPLASAQPRQGNQQHQNPDGVKQRSREGFVQSRQEETAIAMHFHHAIAERDNADIGNQGAGHLGILGKGPRHPASAQEERYRHQRSVTEGEPGSDFMGLMHPVYPLSAEILADKGRQRDAQGHRHHEGEHLDAAGRTDGRDGFMAEPAENPDDDRIGNGHENHTQNAGHGEITDAAEAGPPAAEVKVPPPQQAMLFTEQVNHPGRRDALGDDRSQGRPAHAQSRAAEIPEHHNRVKNDVEHRTDNHHPTGRFGISHGNQDAVAQHGQRHRHRAKVPDAHILADKGQRFFVSSQQSKCRCYEYIPADGHDHRYRQYQQHAVGDEPAGAGLIVAADGVRHQGGYARADAPCHTRQQHHHGKGKTHRRQRQGSHPGDEPGVGKAVGVHGERPGQHGQRHGKQRANNAFTDQHRHTIYLSMTLFYCCLSGLTPRGRTIAVEHIKRPSPFAVKS